MGASPTDTSRLATALLGVSAVSQPAFTNLLWVSAAVAPLAIVGAAGAAPAVIGAIGVAGLQAGIYGYAALSSLLTTIGASGGFLSAALLKSTTVGIAIWGTAFGGAGLTAAAPLLGPLLPLVAAPLTGIALVSLINNRTRSGDYVRPVDRDSFIENGRIELQDLLVEVRRLISLALTAVDDHRDNYLAAVRGIIPASVRTQLETIERTYNTCIAEA